MSKRLPAFGVLAIGVIVLIVLFANNLFTVGSAFEELTDSFRPIMTDEAIATAQADVAGLAAVAEEFNTQVAPAMAQALQMTPDELNAFMGTNFPAVAAGVAALPGIAAQFTDVVGLLAAQQSNFEQADAIPTSDLPASSVPWIVLLIGLGAIAVAILMLGKRDWAWLLAVGFGVVVVASSVGLSFLSKASAADDMNAALKPVYTEELVAGSAQALGVVSAMGQEMQNDMLPALAQQLQMGEEEMQAFLSQFPATAAALAGLGDSLGRFQTMITAFDSQLENYQTIKDTKLHPVSVTVLVAGLLIIVCGVWLFLAERQKEDAPIAAAA
jgi:Sec-independent protein translocase protein TatA